MKGVPSTEDEQAALIDVLQDWKSAHYQELVGACWPRLIVTSQKALRFH